LTAVRSLTKEKTQRDRSRFRPEKICYSSETEKETKNHPKRTKMKGTALNYIQRKEGEKNFIFSPIIDSGNAKGTKPPIQQKKMKGRSPKKR